ncbi:hypothetical protein PoB_000948000 [Plakobranchus ocellatus]|uniref:Dolichyl-diphosphooligosaccharide--protein glycosyltransferase subunit 1 n=1 Tax=Plakobranchus ocellatus TaxID=259542 RepID=A0AAV3YKF8_9GAST|nr:hypothetical protein PoB_000948000 [Plakobranchus ocellatus]
MLHKGSKGGYGNIEMYTEMKTSEESFVLRPRKDPIIFTVEDKLYKYKHVVMKLRMTGPYNYTVASIKANYHSEFLDLAYATFTLVGNEYFHVIPKKDPGEEQRYPGSLYYFMIQVPVTDSDKARLIRDPDTKYYVEKPHNATLPPNALNIPMKREGAVKCHCYVDAPYTVRIYAYTQFKTFVSQLNDYPSTSMIPATYVLLVNIIAIFYCYWAYFQDIVEEDCAQIHVVKDMYKPQSPEQYLVCICTGVLPGSGTNKRVSFLLVGETGSLQTITPEGKFCFSVGGYNY